MAVRQIIVWDNGRMPALAGRMPASAGRMPAPADRLTPQHRRAAALPLCRVPDIWPGRAAYVHGRRHDLWWEFRLWDSGAWQAHLSGLGPGQWERRLGHLAAALGLTALLGLPVANLTPAEQTAADLAVALLPAPDLLLWEEPFALLPLPDRRRAAALVWDLHCREGLQVLAAAEPPGLAVLLAVAKGAATGRC